MKKKFAEVSVGDTFHQAGWLWTITEIAANGRKYQAQVTLADGRLMTREFSAEIGEMYYGEPDKDEEEIN